MTCKVVKSTKRGQITLPKQWRNRYGTDTCVVEMHDNKLTVVPLVLDDVGEEIIFDAKRDNGGKGVPVEEMIRILKKSAMDKMKTHRAAIIF